MLEKIRRRRISRGSGEASGDGMSFRWVKCAPKIRQTCVEPFQRCLREYEYFGVVASSMVVGSGGCRNRRGWLKWKLPGTAYLLFRRNYFDISPGFCVGITIHRRTVWRGKLAGDGLLSSEELDVSPVLRVQPKNRR